MLRRPPRSTQSRSSAASDVYKRQGIRAARAGVRYLWLHAATGAYCRQGYFFLSELPAVASNIALAFSETREDASGLYLPGGAHPPFLECAVDQGHETVHIRRNLLVYFGDEEDGREAQYHADSAGVFELQDVGQEVLGEYQKKAAAQSCQHPGDCAASGHAPPPETGDQHREESGRRHCKGQSHQYGNLHLLHA